MIQTCANTPGKIAALNDSFRKRGPIGGRWVMTPGVSQKGIEFQIAAARAVQKYDAFTPDNDPHGERDFGAFELEGEMLFWKIDYYDKTLSLGSEDPAAPNVTARVLTLMLASEY